MSGDPRDVVSESYWIDAKKRVVSRRAKAAEKKFMKALQNPKFKQQLSSVPWRKCFGKALSSVRRSAKADPANAALLRFNRNITQHDVAFAVGVHRTVWSRIEAGKSAINETQIAIAARCLGVTPSYIFRKAERIAKLFLDNGTLVTY